MPLKIADAVWLATALLHSADPSRTGFTGSEIRERAAQLYSPDRPPVGLNPHIYGHCVANTQPTSGRYRMLYRNADSTFRLYRSDDQFHPRRAKGRTTPGDEDVPEEYRWLLSWYRSEYHSQPRATVRNPADPLMELRGLGKEIWQSLGGGDAVIRWLRSDEPMPPPWASQAAADVDRTRAPTRTRAATRSNDFSGVWEQIRKQEGDIFHTKRGLEFTYQISGDSAVWIRRGERDVNRQLPRGDFEKAWRRQPLSTTRQLQDLQGPSYLFAILTDPRVAA